MAKHLIYLGFTGSSHRIALLDDENILVRSIPVKDVITLPDVPFLNCTVKNGKPLFNLLGAKVLATCPKGITPDFTVDSKNKNFDLSELYADKNKKPDYFYGCYMCNFNESSEKPRYAFYPGTLLGVFDSLSVWDGIYSDKNWFLLADIAVRKSSKRHARTASTLCLSSSGDLALFYRSNMSILYGCGINFIQAGTPILKHKSVPDIKNNYMLSKVTPTIGFTNENKVIWHGWKETEMPDDFNDIFSVWYTQGYRTTVCDLRKFKNAKIFGIDSVIDSSAVIFSESAEAVWMGFIRNCPSLKAVYLPSSVQKIYDYAVPLRRIKNISFYSNSPTVIAFADKYKAICIPCASADDMLKVFYSATDEDYISVADAEGVAIIANTQSKNKGESGTVMSAVLLGCESKGFAIQELEQRFPVTPSGDDPVPKKWLQSPACNTIADNEYAIIRTRLLAAALTLFYPRYTGDTSMFDIPEHGMNAISSELFSKHTLGYYNLYIIESKLKKVSKGSTLIVLLENASTSRVIHKFACNERFYAVLRHMEAVCYYNEEPCGVLRYTDKLPVLYNWNYGNSEMIHIKDSIFKSLLPFTYGTKLTKRQIAGIDLHSGCLATLNFTPNDEKYVYENPFYQGQSQTKRFPQINRLSDITLHPYGCDLGSLFSHDCVYNLSKL